MISTSKATIQDIPAIHALGAAVIPETYASLTFEEYPEGMLRCWWSEDYFAHVLRSPDRLLFLAESADAPITIAFAEAQIVHRQCILWKLYMLPEWHGQGIGSQMLKAIEHSLPLTVEILLTEYLAQNADAGRFYLARSFQYEHIEADTQNPNLPYIWLRRPRQLGSDSGSFPPLSSASQHREKATALGSIPIAVVTVSDSRTLRTDINGHYPMAHRIVPDEPAEIFNGGTRISQRNTAYYGAQTKPTKTLSGFGELFRMLSYQQVGAAAMLSRATAGIFQNKLLISLPGSPNAVQLAWDKLILPENQHLAWEVLR